LSLLILIISSYNAEAAPLASYREGELLVKFKNRAAAKQSHRAVKSVVKAQLSGNRIDHVKLPQGMSVSEAIRLYQADPNVEYAQPNRICRKSSTPNDLLYGSQWNFARLMLPRAWDVVTDASSVIVAILDTGVDYTHPDLRANLWTNPAENLNDGNDNDGNGIINDYYGVSFNSGTVSGNPMDDDTADAHGTHVAGIIGAVGNNGFGVSGMAWRAKLMSVKFLHGTEGLGEISDAIKGIEYATAHGAKIINLSFEVSGLDLALKDAIALAGEKGVLVVSAAGNSGSDLDILQVSPASIRLPNTLSVAFTNRDDSLGGFSDYGRTTVDVAAPGQSILSTVMTSVDTSGYRTTSGTSFASPHVSGLAALVMAQNPGLSFRQVKARILAGAEKLPSLQGKVIAEGIINPTASLLARSFEEAVVFDVAPTRVMPKGTITITGANFGGSGTLYLGNTIIAVTSWTDNIISAALPDGSISDRVTINRIGNGFPLTIVPQPAVILTADPANGDPPLKSKITALVQAPETVVVKTEWDLATGSFVTDDYTSFTKYVTLPKGEFLITLRITDDLGQVTTAKATVYSGVAPIASNTDSTATGGGGGGGGCFIATAAYGSPLHPRVMALRHFRDRFLLTNVPGRLFVKTYYAVSPSLANFITQHDSLRLCARVMLTPLVLFAEKMES
jgi:subtilisin family serine protease